MSTSLHVENVGSEILDREILGPMGCTCCSCIDEMQQFVVTVVVALEHGFDKDNDWLQKDLDSEGRELRLKQRVVNMLPGCKDVKWRAESKAGILRLEKQIYSRFKSFDSTKRRAVLCAFGARYDMDKATIDRFLATEAERLGY